jgi:release factor glutamine methyltransferase
MIDVGTGSGIIPVSLVDNIPDLTAVAIDISPQALEVARINIEKYNLQNKITVLKNDLLADVEFMADLITANLPYIPHDRLDSLEVTRHEPSLALDGGIFGFDIIKRLLSQLPGHLKPGGLALLEIDFSQSDLAIETASKFSTSAKITVLNDLANLPRVLRIQS